LWDHLMLQQTTAMLPSHRPHFALIFRIDDMPQHT
jgi:hypothetical protein